MVIGNSMYTSGLVGVQNGLKQMQRTADNVSKAADPNAAVDMNESAVELIQSKTQIQASIMVLKRDNEMLGSLIDTEA